MTDELWEVEFSCYENDFENECPGIAKAKLIVRGKDIFSALTIASKRIKSFGFDSNFIYGAERKEKEE